LCVNIFIFFKHLNVCHGKTHLCTVVNLTMEWTFGKQSQQKITVLKAFTVHTYPYMYIHKCKCTLAACKPRFLVSADLNSNKNTVHTYKILFENLEAFVRRSFEVKRPIISSLPSLKCMWQIIIKIELYETKECW
jgi:hypothetical protein